MGTLKLKDSYFTLTQFNSIALEKPWSVIAKETFYYLFMPYAALKSV